MHVSQWCHMPNRRMMQYGKGRLGIDLCRTAIAFFISLGITTMTFAICWSLIK
jgi:hypothetical protein